VHLDAVGTIPDHVLDGTFERRTRLHREVDRERDLIDARPRVDVEDDRAVAPMLLECAPELSEYGDLRGTHADVHGAVSSPGSEARIVIRVDRLGEDLGGLEVDTILVVHDRRGG
jgi:hypothetical protein